jgi:hypothetical protein
MTPLEQSLRRRMRELVFDARRINWIALRIPPRYPLTRAAWHNTAFHNIQRAKEIRDGYLAHR